MRPAFFRMNARVFTVFLIVGVVMLAGASYFVVGIGQARLRDASGEHLRQVADHAAAAVDTYVYHRIIDASVLARIPQVREDASAGSRQPFDREAVLKADREWQQAGAAAPSVRAVMAARTSMFLADVSKLNPIYKELLLTDRQGRIVAASDVTSNYAQAGEEWWRESFKDGVHGQLTVSDVYYDQSAKTWGIAIAVPVEEPASGALAGVLKAVADINEVGAVLAGVRLGDTGDASLLREDGSFVLSLRPVAPNARFFATDLLRERLGMAKQGQPQTPLYFGASTTDGTPRLVGVAFSQLKASYPRLTWVVAVSQAESELFAPVHAQGTSLLIVLGLTAIVVLLLALWFSMRLAAPPEVMEMDMHLVQHPRVHRMEEDEESTTEGV
jgi:hypothetical protein